MADLSLLIDMGFSQEKAYVMFKSLIEPVVLAMSLLFGHLLCSYIISFVRYTWQKPYETLFKIVSIEYCKKVL